MKRIIVAFCILVSSFACAEYDGMINFLGDMPRGYKGEVLILKSKAAKYRADGYEGFYLDYTKPWYSHDGGDRNNVYQCCDRYGAKYDILAGKKFKVSDVLKHPKAETSPLEYGDIWYLKLTRIDNGDIVYYKYDARYKNSFAFVSEKYLNYRKSQSLGKAYVTRGSNWMPNHTPILDLKSGKEVSIEAAKRWTCEDVRIDDQTGLLALILKDDTGNTVAFDVEKLDNHKFVFSGEQADKMKEAYGEKSYLQILKSVVVVGFTTEMVKITWGEPDQIEDFGDAGEQWFFQGYYILVKDDKVIAVQ